MTQYMLLIYADESGYADATPEQWSQMAAEHGAFTKAVVDLGGTIVGGAALEPTSTATSVRADGDGGFSITDGPFAETKEVLGGYYVIEARDLDQALEFAKLCPAHGGTIEVRPVTDTSGL